MFRNGTKNIFFITFTVEFKTNPKQRIIKKSLIFFKAHNGHVYMSTCNQYHRSLNVDYKIRRIIIIRGHRMWPTELNMSQGLNLYEQHKVYYIYMYLYVKGQDNKITTIFVLVIVMLKASYIHNHLSTFIDVY